MNLGPSIKIFREKKHSLSIEPLVSVVQFKFLSTSGFIRNLNPNVPITSLYFGLPFSYREGYTLGFMGQLGYRFRLKNNLRLGIDTSLQNFKGDAEVNLNTIVLKSF